ncbi:DUF4831 family protein [Paludibacter sp. 221]|uniref:DUF4831 family protein n=1 Tax=Paludibacter sp. 221 TaxID=2302939 RepID=UPI0013D8B447|nr:DUF4831 family protein [Paludibacter sp. 221]NDV46406.1 DUF4831 family protein [Paludibacter sp. 221]
MKKLFFIFAFLLTCCAMMFSQASFSLPQDEPVIVYSLPKTELCIEVELEKTLQKPGEFFRYSERYLATKDVITEEKNSFRLKSVNVKTRAIADPDRTYAVSSENGVLSRLSVNEKGLLCGVDVPCKEGVSDCDKNKNNAEPKKRTTKPLPLTEEYMLAGSTAKMAEGAAKQIYRIRESRLALLAADVEHFPADGESFKVMLSEMNRLERQLTELFTGTSVTEVQKHTIYLTPSAEMKGEVLFRISSLSGLVSAADLSGSPYYIDVIPQTIKTYRIEETKKTKKKGVSEALQIYSLLPAEAKINVGDGRNIFFSGEFVMPQFGHVVPVPQAYLQKENAKVYIDEQTGRLLRAE